MMNNKEKEMKKEKIKPILKTLEDLMEEDWDEAKEFLHSLDEIYWIDNYYSLAIIDKLSYYFGEMDDYDLDNFIPEIFWKDRNNALDAIDLIAESKNFNIGAYVPSYLWEDKYAALYIVSKEYTGLSYVSDKLENYQDIVFTALSNLEEQIEDSYHNWPCLPWDSHDHLEWFMEGVSSSLKADKDFILELLEYDYFSDVFDVIYDWIDPCLWSDGDFVINVLRIDFTESTLNRMSEELKSNEDFLQVLADELLEDIDDIKEQIYGK